MSGDKVPGRWADPTRLRPLVPVDDQEEPVEEVAANSCFATVRGAGRAAPMVEFRLPSGAAEAFGYSWLRQVTADLDRHLVLHFPPAGRVTLEGYRLGKLRGLLQQHRVTWVGCVDQLHAGDDGEPVVTGIRVELTESNR